MVDPNPYPHPKSLKGPTKLMVPAAHLRTALAMLHQNQKKEAIEKNLKVAAQNYFGWELMNGAKIATLRKDPYFKYMESK